jgi:hypothetical protein
MSIRQLPRPKLVAKVPITRLQPSTNTNSINLNGKETIIGDNIIIPMAIRILATT